METRSGGELRALGGRRVAGVLLRYGDLAVLPDGRSERFEPGSLNPLPDAIPVNVQHDPSMMAGELALRGDGEAVRAEGEVTNGVHDLIRRRALNGFSVEFRSLREREEPAPLHGRAVRVIERADLLGAAVVDTGAYPQSTVEARRALGAKMRTAVPVGGQKLYCSCSAAKTGSETASYVRFARGAFKGVEAADVSAVTGGLSQTVATNAGGSLRLRTARDGSLRIELDPLDTRHGRDLRDLVRAGVAVYARPVWDPEASTWELEGDTALVTAAVFRLLLVKPVRSDRAKGLGALKMGREGRGLSMRRRLLIAGAA